MIFFRRWPKKKNNFENSTDDDTCAEILQAEDENGNDNTEGQDECTNSEDVIVPPSEREIKDKL